MSGGGVTIEDLAEEAWASYGRAVRDGIRCVVQPSIPILFFGDYGRYLASPRRILTVGLNPSRVEFPDSDRFLRFEAARWTDSRPPTTGFLRALSDYFRLRPYDQWFKPSFEEMLRGLGASYYDGAVSGALHTDICSPLATDPTWSKLRDEREPLAAAGIELWHRLVEHLEPDVILISVARRHLDKIRFRRAGVWSTLYTVERSNPFIVEALPLELPSDKRTLLVFGRAANLPFGTVAGKDKRLIGARIQEVIDA